MTTTINADNGVSSGSAGLKSSADSSGVLALQTNGTTAVSISASQVVTLTNALPVASGGTGATTLAGASITTYTGTETLTNKTLTGAVMNGTVGATTPNAGAFTTLSATGVTTVQAGTAALPAITTTGDTNTGIFFPAADTIAFAEGGAEAVRIDSSGNLLVGTTTAQTGAKLAVTGGIQGTITSGTAANPATGTSVNFTSLPTWVKKITVMLSGLSHNGGSAFNDQFIIQIGAGSITSSGYTSIAVSTAATAGFLITNGISGAATFSGVLTIALIGSNLWAQSGNISGSGTCQYSAGSVTLGGTLDRVRITTPGGTDSFDAGAVNILYEG